ncbi:hypothetical protein EDB86DRAFT_2840982 [Lactarius hatsudake]|nr:hypothetical protein EDB86DRAFT_2840982 [Lactarius hatsudake]
MVQSTYPAISAKQVHKAWTTMSETLWKKNIEPLPSVRALLNDLKDDVDILNLPEMEGIEQVAWVMKKIISPLQGKIVEVGIDATYNMNSMHLKLYAILGEHDNAGFPLSYCLLTMASSVEDRNNPNDSEGKVPGEVSEQELQEGIIPLSGSDPNSLKIHVSVLSSQSQDNMSMVSLTDGLPDSIWPRVSAHGGLPLTSGGPKSCCTPTHLDRSAQDAENYVGPLPPTGGNPNPGQSPLTGSNPNSRHAHMRLAGGRQEAGVEPTASSKLTIWIPTSWRYRRAESIAEDEPDEETTLGRCTFCPIKYREAIVDMMEHHFCAHPLIPGYSALTPEGIKAWAVKQMYSLCVHHDLLNLWAYLWENWEPREIPHLKMTMFIEGHWWHVKEDYLQHFSLPHVDLLVWVLVTKLGPMYYRKLDVVLNNIGCFHKLPWWRRDFKFEWNKATRTPITMPLNEKYKPDVNQFVCTCLQFVVSRFLLCKHLVQQFQPVNPKFFLEVTRNRCPPFWSHPSLKPLPSEEGSEPGHPVARGSDGDDKANVEVYYNHQNMARNVIDNSHFESDNDDNALIDMENGREFEGEMYKEEMEKHICLI